ncbi:hypothetical protein MSG28_002121 [Choristoneura fumiferana]|uniref:Uncharacterized protein n=1 Tax=Choristoneura fumiferana TaxID=7141 RepID=A0ACC0JU84_CHOFU|nr:hypothetical protein MSG28_002121 [Choristoneura fumiferana]
MASAPSGSARWKPFCFPVRFRYSLRADIYSVTNIIFGLPKDPNATRYNPSGLYDRTTARVVGFNLKYLYEALYFGSGKPSCSAPFDQLKAILPILQLIMPTATTMGYLADSPVPEREESALRSILRSLDENFPQNWRDWKVIHYTMDELLGVKIYQTKFSKVTRGRGSQSSATPNSKSTNIQATPRPTTPTPLSQDSSGHLLASILSQQMALMNKFCAAQVEQQEEIKALRDRSRITFVLEKNSPVHESESSEDDDTYDFMPKTTEQEPKIRKADPKALKYGIECQRLGQSGWANLRYGETGKLFQATPAFCALKTNTVLAGVAPKWKFAETLESFDGTLGAITNGLIQQRLIFEEILASLPKDVRKKVKKEYLGPESKFKKNSTDLLQYVCGKRTEVIRLRRKVFTPRNKVIKQIIHEIPPSETHLFEEKMLTDVVKEQVRSWPRKRIGHRLVHFANPLNNIATATQHREKVAKDQKRKEVPPQENQLSPISLLRRKRSGQPGNDVFQAGRLAKYARQWEGAPTSIQKIIKGYRIPFGKKPPLEGLRKNSFRWTSDKKSSGIGCPQEKSPSKGFLSTFFLRKKSDNTYRPIFNLKRLNEYVLTPKFHLVNHLQIPRHLRIKDFMMKVDISQAYFHIPIHPSHRRFLSMAYQGHVYEMTCLPFGLASAPSAFAMITNWIAQQLRRKGLRVIVYLDDFLFMHENSVVLERQASMNLEYLGITWDSEINAKSLSGVKVTQLRKCISKLLEERLWSWHDAKVFLGKLEFAAAVIPLGRLHCRFLQRALRHLEEERSTHEIQDTSSYNTKTNMVGRTLTKAPQFIMGLGSDCERASHVGKMDTITEELAQQCKRALDSVRSTESFRIRKASDPVKTTIAHATQDRKAGGHQVPEVARSGGEDWYCCIMSPNCPRHSWGLQMDSEDGLSRQKALPEWHLSRRILAKIFQKFGKPQIDLFASKRSAVVPLYVSEDATDKDSLFTDAFSRTWCYDLGWIFPPPAIIPRVLSHLQKAKGRFLLVTPLWDNAFWEPELCRLAQGPPFQIPNLKDHLKDLRTDLPPPGVENLRLGVWMVQAGQNKKSTLKTYRPIWKRWCVWAKTTNTSVNNPSARHLADYLCYLHTVLNLRARTIALHKSVVANFSNPLQAKELSGHPLIKRILKGIIAGDPPVKRCITWCIEDLLSFLKRYDVDESSLFAVARHTCVLLLLATGRRVHDLTLLSLENGAFEEKPGRIVFWPKFGSKTDSSSYRQSGWLLKCTSERSERRLDLVYWVKKLIYVSAERRRPSNLLNLFITTRGTAKNASRTVIAGWIRTLFKEAGISASAGSFRAVVATSNWTSNRYNIDEVLARGNWKSRNTFINHYFQEYAWAAPADSKHVSMWFKRRLEHLNRPVLPPTGKQNGFHRALPELERRDRYKKNSVSRSNITTDKEKTTNIEG